YYSVITHSNKDQKASLISVLKDVLFAKENPTAVVQAIADPRIKVITLTITEKGYHQDPATGKLQVEDPEIIQDLNIENPAQTALGYIVRGLDERRRNCGKPITLLSCDNLPKNGHTLLRLIQDFCECAAPDLLPWIAKNVSCPCTMVDGIVPAATQKSLKQAEKLLGVRDEAAVTCEEFRQWVIEDDFATEHPDWKAAGVELVADVRPYEEMKLRLLNGCHSALAYLGYLGGYQTIAEVMSNHAYKAFAWRLICEEAGPSFALPNGYILEEQAELLISRFSNPGLAHRTGQICMDGSQKLPQRLLNSLYSQLERNRSMPCTLLAVAAWIMYVSGTDEQGNLIDVSDPLAEELATLHGEGNLNAEQIAQNFLSLETIFGPKATQPKNLADLLVSSLSELRSVGAKASVTKFTNRESMLSSERSTE
ncbi:MAG: mannitol dehydrogenase family protein, partial [Sneathiella sp.]